MAGKASKDKGKTGERELCKILEGVFEGSFIRVPNSGAFVGGKNFHRKEALTNEQNKLTTGDIITPDFMPKFVLESKFYKDFPFHSLVGTKPIPLLDGWIQQNLDCVDDDDFWMVCFKINRKGWFGVFEEKYVSMMYLHNYSVYHSNKLGKYIVVELNTFLEKNKAVILKLSQNPSN
jgi:hypothetical protein